MNNKGRSVLVLHISTFAEDEQGNEVFLAAGTPISEISDAGPYGNAGKYEGWNVSFLVKHPGMPVEEVVTMDAVKLLKALDGQA